MDYEFNRKITGTAHLLYAENNKYVNDIEKRRNDSF